MPRERREYSHRVSRVEGQIHRAGSEEYRYYDGWVRTPLGYVVVYIEPRAGKSGLNISVFRAILDGREYTLRLPYAVTPRGAATVAGQWIRTLHGREVDHVA